MSAAVQTPAKARGEVRITGVLASAAELRTTPGDQPHAMLALHIEAGAGLPFVALQDCGCGPAAYIAAKAKEHQLRRGAHVTVYATGITPRTDHGTAVLRLHGVTDVVPEVLTPQTGPDGREPTQPEA